MSSKTWLMLRGFWDKNNKKSLEDNSDVWLQLFSELVGKEQGIIYYLNYKQTIPLIYNNIAISKKIKLPKINYIFARGGHPEYTKIILKYYKNAYKIYYGAGARIIPKDGIKYNLILVDTKEQLEKAQKRHPNSNVVLWIKPAAKHFKPVKTKKKYELVYVADTNSSFQEDIKRVKWVYKTAPKGLKILHLGKSSLKPPKNITVKHVSKLEMPKYYSQAKMCIVPYKSYDSAPRVIPEALSCDIPVLAMNTVNTNWKISPHFLIRSKKQDFWCNANEMIEVMKDNPVSFCSPVSEFVFYDLGIYNVKNTAEHIRSLIHE